MKRKERSRGEEAGRVPHGAFLTGRVSGLLPGESLWAEWAEWAGWAGWAGGAAVRDDRDRPAHRREVHFALENDGWNCTFECEVHVSAPGGPGGRRRGPHRPSRGPWRHRLSKSVAKARIAPERRRRIVDIPRFLSRPIPARGAFATDLDTPPPRTTTGTPPAPPRASQATYNGAPPARRPTRAIMTILVSPGIFLVRKARCGLR
mgnify:CR=1 FL=1